MHSFDLGDILPLTATPAELMLRGTLIYWFLFLIFRFVLRRDTGSAGISDILFVVLLGDAAQNGMIGQAMSVGDAMTLIGTLVVWNYLINYLGYHIRFFEWLTDPPPICLIRNGRKRRAALRSQHLSDVEILAKLRDGGLERLSDVKAMYLESDGSFSIIKRKR
jgi:uncharacterized membrane protein YcaP (DUF421 family)